MASLDGETGPNGARVTTFEPPRQPAATAAPPASGVGDDLAAAAAEVAVEVAANVAGETIGALGASLIELLAGLLDNS